MIPVVCYLMIHPSTSMYSVIHLMIYLFCDLFICSVLYGHSRGRWFIFRAEI